MGYGDECPYYPGKRYLDWRLEDPAGASKPFEQSATRSTVGSNNS